MPNKVNRKRTTGNPSARRKVVDPPAKPARSTRAARSPRRKHIVLTIGHSTRTLADFVALLKTHDVACLVDVRSIPRSLHNPQFNKTALPRPLKRAGIEYIHMPGLGGLRHALKESINIGWRNASFRGYADYMQTPDFEENLEALISLAAKKQIAIMCAEAVPWRCHRSLIADALVIRGIRVEDIMTPTRRTAHTLTPFAHVTGTTITYPAEIPGRTRVATKKR